jgi:protein-tyrosine phosphatase
MSFDRTLDESALFRICFVCTGNICRSPMAESVFKSLVRKAGLAGAIAVVSAGTGDWHVGERSDDRTVEALRARGYDGTSHRARQFDPDWFGSLDLVVVFDRSQERILRTWANNEVDRSKVQLILNFDGDNPGAPDVPDPYYSDAAMFDQVLGMIERACVSLFRQVSPGIHNGPGIHKESP